MRLTSASLLLSIILNVAILICVWTMSNTIPEQTAGLDSKSAELEAIQAALIDQHNYIVQAHPKLDTLIGMARVTGDAMETISADIRSSLPRSGQIGVLLGDSIHEYSGQLSPASIIERRTGAVLINAAIGGTTLSYFSQAAGDYVDLSGLALVRALTTNDWGAPYAAAERIAKTDNDDNRHALDRLKSADMSSVDFVVIAYGRNDFTRDVPLNQWRQAVREAADLLRSTYPHLTIYFFGPPYSSRYVSQDDGLNTDIHPNKAGLFVADYTGALVEECEARRLQCWDPYKIGVINKWNADLMLVDGVHLSIPEGVTAYGEAGARFLSSH